MNKVLWIQKIYLFVEIDFYLMAFDYLSFSSLRKWYLLYQNGLPTLYLFSCLVLKYISFPSSQVHHISHCHMDNLNILSATLTHQGGGLGIREATVV